MQTIIHQISNYITQLDWGYMLTFILLVYAISNLKLIKQWRSNKKLSQRYLVLLIGVIYGIILFFIRGYDTSKIEVLLQTFVFALVFHKLLIDRLVGMVFHQKNKQDV